MKTYVSHKEVQAEVVTGIVTVFDSAGKVSGFTVTLADKTTVGVVPNVFLKGFPTLNEDYLVGLGVGNYMWEKSSDIKTSYSAKVAKEVVTAIETTVGSAVTEVKDAVKEAATWFTGIGTQPTPPKVETPAPTEVSTSAVVDPIVPVAG